MSGNPDTVHPLVTQRNSPLCALAITSTEGGSGLNSQVPRAMMMHERALRGGHFHDDGRPWLLALVLRQLDRLRGTSAVVWHVSYHLART